MPTFELDDRGYFWWADEPVPEGHFAPESAVTGQIQITTNGAANLILDDVLPRTPGRPSLQYGAIPGDAAELAVVGLIRRGQAYVRLEQLSQAGLNFGSARRTSETLKARICVQGSRLIADLPPNRYCTSVRLSLAGFDEWLQLQNPKIDEGAVELTAHIPRYMERHFEVPGATISIGADAYWWIEGPKTEIRLRQEGFIIYAPRSPMTLDEVRDVTRKIEDLLVLLTDCERSLGFPQIRASTVADWCQVSYETLQRPEKEISRSDLWTLFPELSPDFGVIANAWFSKSVDFGPGFHLYLGNRRGVSIYVEHRFASLVWGLEVFHRTNDPTRNTALTKKIERILSAVDDRDRRWLENMIKHADEPNLAQRIFSVLSPLPIGFDQAELKRFAKKCADERNTLSHFGGRGPGDDYFEHLRTWTLLIYALDYLYHARILQELGFTDSALREIFWNIYPSARIRDMLARNGLKIFDRDSRTSSAPEGCGCRRKAQRV
jgi:hypothetical protein